MSAIPSIAVSWTSKPTLIAVDEVILDDYGSPIDRRVLLRLTPIIAHVRHILPSRRGAIITRYSQDMTSQEFFRGPKKVCEQGARLAIAGGKENLSGRNKEYLARLSAGFDP